MNPVFFIVALLFFNQGPFVAQNLQTIQQVSNQSSSQTPKPDQAPPSTDEHPKTKNREPVKLPGLTIDFNNHCVDLEATVCLDRGLLELIACSKGSKEHESIVAVSARAMHIHTALLLLGARNGNPAMRIRINDDQPRWVQVAPKGDRIDVFFVFAKDGGKTVERPVSDFVVHAKSDRIEPDTKPKETQIQKDRRPKSENISDRKNNKFHDTFLFAGSRIQDNQKGPRSYLADNSGNIISIVTFGDELLCHSKIQSHDNGMLMWQLKPRELPKPGSKIILRLRPSPSTTNNSKTK